MTPVHMIIYTRQPVKRQTVEHNVSVLYYTQRCKRKLRNKLKLKRRL